MTAWALDEVTAFGAEVKLRPLYKFLLIKI